MKPPFIQIHSAIEKHGQVHASRSAYVQQNVALFGPETHLPASKTIAGQLAKPGATQPKSSVVVVGEAPDGFGKQVLWHPNDAGLAIVVFLNAADFLGVMISGVRATDTIEIVSAAGIASFAEETENEGVGAFIGILAAGATVASTSFGAPELAPVIGAAAEFAKSRFPENKVAKKLRDPFGENLDGDKARQEGGVIVSLPEARRIFTSGNSDHEERWIKEPGTRDTAHLPDHVKGKGAFFLQSRSRNKHTAGAEGDIIIYPWDYKFTDNSGFYRLDILLKRGSGKLPVIE
jgi:hypothetical protein